MGRTESQARRHQLLSGAAIGLFCWALLAVASFSGWLAPFDLRLLDLKLKLRGERAADKSIVVVGVDDETIRGYGRWPLPRDAYALLIAGLEEGGAKDGSFIVDGRRLDRKKLMASKLPADL